MWARYACLAPVHEGGVAEGLLGRTFLNHFRVHIDNARGVVELAPK